MILFLPLSKVCVGSDPDASVYWLARMIDGGEDVKFIARRMLILAAEDIGLANPNALLLAQSTFDAVHKIGYPEARIILSQCAIYLAYIGKKQFGIHGHRRCHCPGKSNRRPSSATAHPECSTKLMKELGYGKDYKYAHSFEKNFAEQDFLPQEVKTHRFYTPQNNPLEIKNT